VTVGVSLPNDDEDEESEDEENEEVDEEDEGEEVEEVNRDSGAYKQSGTTATAISCTLSDTGLS
jgi:hypothetical protein